ncbi:MAG: PilZ domain-containing protein [Ruminococcus sp.]|nr:PilZ domain-containing protein [Ruminococcus sp.]
MISKEKIKKIDVYTEEGERILTTARFTFPRDFFKIRGYELVAIRGRGLPVVDKEHNIDVIFEYVNGTRIKCRTHADISTTEQLNFHVDDGEVLEERRQSYKVATKESAFVTAIERGDEVIELEEQYEATILNINLGGVLLHCDIELFAGDVVDFIFLPDNMSVKAEILRVQKELDGSITGYGCRFLGITPSQEEKLVRHLFECQMAERERLKQKEGR